MIRLGIRRTQIEWISSKNVYIYFLKSRLNLSKVGNNEIYKKEEEIERGEKDHEKNIHTTMWVNFHRV